MRDQELVNALRCVSTAGGPMGDCKKCPFYKTEPVPEDLAGKVNLTEWSSCDVDAVELAAADRIANQSTHIAVLQQEIEKLRGRLMQYEDTGLEPAMCANYKTFEDEAISKGVPFKRIVALMEADRAGLLAVLPCKVGDTIYHTSKVRTSHFENDKIIIDDEGRWKIYEMPFALVHLTYIGKSYFLTREEAEEALEAMKDE